MGQIEQILEKAEEAKSKLTSLEQSIPQRHPSYGQLNVIIKAYDSFLKVLKGEESPLTYNQIEEVGYKILKNIAPQGHASPLSRLPNLQQWLSENYPQIKAESLRMFHNDLWSLIVLTADGKNGVAVPAIDLVIGPGQIMGWYVGGRYDGNQSLREKNIQTLAHALFDNSKKEWIPVEKGRIDPYYI